LVTHHDVPGHVIIKSQLSVIDQIKLPHDLTTYTSSSTTMQNTNFSLKTWKSLTPKFKIVISVYVHSPRQDVPNDGVILRPVITLLGPMPQMLGIYTTPYHHLVTS